MLSLHSQYLPEAAQKKVQAAAEAFKARKFSRAESILAKLILKYPKHSKIYVQLADYKNYLGKTEEAVKYYQKAVKVQPDARVNIAAYSFLTSYNLDRGNYELSKRYGQKFLALSVKSRTDLNSINRMKKTIDVCEYALEYIKKPLNFRPENLKGGINKFKQQYFPSITADDKTIFFTGIEYQDENIYYSVFENEAWSIPQSVKAFNTNMNEGTCSVSGDGKVIVFTSCQAGPGRVSFGSCDLYMSRREEDIWSPPNNLGQTVNSSRWESQPTLSADGTTLYFVTDRPGGIGKKDIWMTKLNDYGKWTSPQNLGPDINTKEQEISPFIHFNNKTLFFSSNGHLGFGGFDIFKASKMLNVENQTFEWKKVENIGYPINKHGDQVSLIINAEGTKGYFTDEIISNGRAVQSRLKYFKVPEEIEVEKSYYIKLKIFDKKTKQHTPATVQLFNVMSNKIVNQKYVRSGEHTIIFNEGQKYALYVISPRHLFYSKSLDYSESKDNKPIEEKIYLEPIRKNVAITLNNIFFESNSYVIQPESESELAKLTDFLKKNNKLLVEIGAHTDDVGTDEDNYELSLNRAKAVVLYLEEKGIANENLVYKGYGETKPKATNETEEGRALNRRIEFKILSSK